MKKRKYVVSGEVTISVTTTVMARSVKEAIKRAESNPMGDFCHMCSQTPEPEDEEWRASELDGTVQGLTAEEAEDEDD